MVAKTIASFQYLINSVFGAYVGLSTLIINASSLLGSKPSAILPSFFGISRLSAFALIVKTMYYTLGWVIIAEIECSSLSRCLKTSMWSIPKKPHLNPLPRAALDSKFISTLPSVRHSLYRAFSRSS
jgi:hypothetical protein